MRHITTLLTGTSLLGVALLSFTSVVKAEDKVFLENGDHFSGEITSYDQSHIAIKTVYGVFDVPLRYVKGAYTDNQAEGLEIAQSLAMYKGQALGPDQDQDQDESQDIASVKVMAPTIEMSAVEGEAVRADNTQEESLRADGYKNFWGADFSGNVNLGFDMKRGNSETEALNIDATIKSTVRRHDFKIRGEYNREEDGGMVSVDDRNLTVWHDYNFTDKWFIGSKVKFEQDEASRLDIRTTASSGLGYHWIQREDLSVKFVAGPGYIYEEFEDGRDETDITYNWAFDYNQKFYDDLFRLFHEHSFVTPAKDTDAYLFESSSGLRVPIRKGIVMSGQVDYDWDNSPARNSKKEDTTYSLKIGYEWP